MLLPTLFALFAVGAFAGPDISEDEVLQQDQDLVLGSAISELLISSPIARRQTFRCNNPGYVKCPNAGYCCPPSWICQPNNPRGGAIGWCCPSYALQCNGLACCDGSRAFCCGTTCCPNGSRCSNGRCTFPTPPTSFSLTRPTLSLPTSLSLSTFSSATFCPVTFNGLAGRQAGNPCPNPTSVAPTPTETRVPKATMTFNYQRLRQGKKKMSARKQTLREQAVDQLFQSMCKGMISRGKSETDVFTFTDDDTVKQQNRKNAGCGSSPCNTGASGASCDEFPFASTTDGGVGAVFSCIAVLAQNIQGGVISAFKKKNTMQTGEHYQFEIEGYDCKTMSPKTRTYLNITEGVFVGNEGEAVLSRRDLIPGGADEETESYPPFDDFSTNNTVIISIGDLPAGTYTVGARINQGSVSFLRVIDYQGQILVSIDGQVGSGSQESLTFTLSSNGVGLGVFMDTQLDTLNISSTMHAGTTSAAPRMSEIPMWVVAGTLTWFIFFEALHCF